ncbi:MAG: helix-turn-helix domain-containing protein [Hyphomonadaceae bacterium]
MNELDTYTRDYRRQMTRAAFQSLFWNVLQKRKQDAGLTLKGLADKLGIHKSYMTRSFSSPPNWQIDKLSDLADALEVELVIEARDQKTGRIWSRPIWWCNTR